MKPVARASIRSTDQHYLHHIETAGFTLAADEPVKLGGGGRGPAPYDLYLASLAACTAITLRMYAEKKGWELGELKVELTLHKDESGRGHVNRVLHASGELDDAKWQRLLEIVAKTPVTQTMRDGVEIHSERGS